MNRIGFFTTALGAAVIALALASTASAQSAADLLEQGIYTEETVGDLVAAVGIYERIVKHADADRRHVAQALFRMGRCHLRTGNEGPASRAFEKLVAEYADQRDLVAEARSLLPGLKLPELEIATTPWEDGELLRYTFKAPGGTPAGDVTLSVESGSAGGRDSWKVESILVLPELELLKFGRIEFGKAGADPIRSLFVHTQIGRLEVEYEGGERKIMMSRPGGEPEPFNQKLDGKVYDNEQFIFLVRQLPLAEGYETSITLTGRPGMVETAPIKVLGKETVTVPAGTFDCFKTRLGSESEGQTQWISDDEHRYVVMIENTGAVIELTEVTRLDRGPVHYRNSGHGFSLKAPAGWDVFESAFGTEPHGPFGFFIELFPPEMKAWGVFCSLELDASKPHAANPRQALMHAIGATARKKHKDFAIREESWTDTTLCGLAAASCIADHSENGVPTVEYYIALSGDGIVYWFGFKTERNRLDALKDEFDAIAATLRLGMI